MSARSRMVEALARRCAGRRGIAVLLLSGALSLPPAADALAAMTLDGDASAMVVTVSDVPRQEVVAELSRRFGFQVSGSIFDNEPVNGRFRGDLGDVLVRLLPANNFLVVYEGGKPARILLSDRGQAAEPPPDPALRSLQPNQGIPGEGPHGGGNYGGGEAQYIDPALQDPALQDPAFQDPSLQDPALQDPALQDPAMQGQQMGELPPQPQQ